MIIRIRKSDKAIFDAIKTGAKSVETRAATTRYKHIPVGTTLIFMCDGEKLEKTLGASRSFASIAELTTYYKPEQILPGASASDLEKMYAGFSGYIEKIKQHGLVAWELS